MTRVALAGVLLGAWSVLAGAAKEAPAAKAAPAAEPGRAAGSKKVKVLARGTWPFVPVYEQTALPRQQQQWALRRARQLIALAGPHAPEAVARALRLKAVDFKKHLLLAVADGTLPLVGVSGGGPPSAPNRVAIRRVEVRDQVLVVTWSRPPRRKQDPILTHPLEVVLVPRFAGEVRFEQAPPDGKEGPKIAGKAVRVLARALFPDGWKTEVPAIQWVVRSAEELVDPRIKASDEVIERMRQAQVARYARALKVPAIDFETQMILGVSGGVQNSDGYRVEVTRVVERGRNLVVYWRLRAPAPGGTVNATPSHPAEVVLVKQFAGPVKFRQEAAAKD